MKTNNRIREEETLEVKTTHNYYTCPHSEKYNYSCGECLEKYIAELLKSQKESLVEKIEKIDIYDSGEFGGGQISMRDDILSLIKQSN